MISVDFSFPLRSSGGLMILYQNRHPVCFPACTETKHQIVSVHTNVVLKVIVRKEIVKTQVLLRPQIVVFMFLFVYGFNKQDILSFRGDGRCIFFYFG